MGQVLPDRVLLARRGETLAGRSLALRAEASNYASGLMMRRTFR